MTFKQILNLRECKKNKDGIWISKDSVLNQNEISEKSWKRIYSFSLNKLIREKNDFNKNKLQDHLKYVESSYKFTKNTVYLEIGCGPAYIGEYLMKKYGSYFVGVDFNYELLVTLKKYFDKKGLKNYVLIYGDIMKMPIKKNTIDYIYGGGVIEHLRDTNAILKKLYFVLKRGGVCFNTIPAFNFWWLIRFWNNIPNLPFLKGLFEFIHLKLLKGYVLDKYYGYELSYTMRDLYQMHRRLHFKEISAGPFVFHPSSSRLGNKILRKLYIMLTSNRLFSPVYYIYGKK